MMTAMGTTRTRMRRLPMTTMATMTTAMTTITCPSRRPRARARPN